MLYICQDLYSFDFETVLPFLPSERRKKAERFRDRTDRANSVFSWLLLIYALFRKTGFLPEKDEYFLLAENGKPSFENCPSLFSLSHCRKGIVCAVTDRKNGEIGVDIQDCRAVSPALLKKVCSKKNRKKSQNPPKPKKNFPGFGH